LSIREQSVPWLTTTVIALTIVLGISAGLIAEDQSFLALTASGSPGMVASMLVASFGGPLGMWIWHRRTAFMVAQMLLGLTAALFASISGSVGYWWAIALGILSPVLVSVYRRRVLSASRDVPIAPTDNTSLVPPN
jgi:hypothetical protein